MFGEPFELAPMDSHIRGGPSARTLRLFCRRSLGLLEQARKPLQFRFDLLEPCGSCFGAWFIHFHTGIRRCDRGFRRLLCERPPGQRHKREGGGSHHTPRGQVS